MQLKNLKIANCSGVFSSSFLSLREWIDCGLNGVVLKTTTYEPKKGYPSPNVAIDKEKIVQAMGLPNPGYKETAKISKKIKKEYPEIFVINSFTTADKKEMEEMISYLSKNSDALEFNISCPHAKGLGNAVGYDFELLEELCEEAEKHTEKPFGLKMPYYPTDELLENCIESTKAVDFYTNINSVGKAMIIGEDYGVSNKLGGLSGPAIKPLAMGQVYRTRQKTNKHIFGCGGIVDRKDVAEFLKAGADSVQLGSCIRFYKTKKDFVEEAKKGFNHELTNYFENQGIKEWD